MSKKNPIDEGDFQLPAFPYADFQNGVIHRGMTLREWYAGQALVGYLASYGPDGNPASHAKNIAITCFRIADAMIAAGETS